MVFLIRTNVGVFDGGDNEMLSNFMFIVLVVGAYIYLDFYIIVTLALIGFLLNYFININLKALPFVMIYLVYDSIKNCCNK